MLGAVLLFGILAGLDNFQVCSSVGLLPIGARRRVEMAAAFTLCEAAAPLLGLLIGHVLLMVLTGTAPYLLLLCGVAVMCGRWGRPPGLRGSPWTRRPARGPAADEGVRPTLFALPLSLSLDNLIGGAGISALHYPVVPAALLIGLISAAMSCAGLYLGGSIRRFIRWRAAQHFLEPAVGAYLCLLAVRLLIAGRS